MEQNRKLAPPTETPKYARYIPKLRVQHTNMLHLTIKHILLLQIIHLKVYFKYYK